MSSDVLQLGRSLESSLDARPVLQQYATISEHEVPQAVTPRVDWGHTPWKPEKVHVRLFEYTAFTEAMGQTDISKVCQLHHRRRCFDIRLSKRREETYVRTQC
jgi:hypothetical protein